MSSKLKIFFPFCILVSLVLLLPILVMIIASFQNSAGNFSLVNYKDIVMSSYYRKAIFNSLSISLTASLFSIVVAAIGAWSLTFFSNTEKNILITIFNMSSSFAGIPLAFSLIILLGNAGILKAIATACNLADKFNLYSLSGVTISYTFFEVPLGILFLFPAFEAFSPEWHEANEILGGKKIFYFRKVILPVILPNIIEVFTLLFANAMGTYETVYALTGNNIVTIATLIGSLINGELIANIPLACAFATLFIVIMTFIVWCGNKVTDLKGRETTV